MQYLDNKDTNLQNLQNIILSLIISAIIIMMYLPIINGIELFFQISQEVYILIKKYIFIRIFSSPAELILYILIGLFLGFQKI